MITLRRTTERYHHRRGKHDSWLTFNPRDQADRFADGFGALELLNEDRLPPGACVPRLPQHNAEIITYVREGALAYNGTMGRSGVINAGEFRRRRAMAGVDYAEKNASRTHWAHIFQVWLRASEAKTEAVPEQKRFSSAKRKHGLCVVASSNACGESLRIGQNALLMSALLYPGQHVVHELLQGRTAWLHVVQGEVRLDDVTLSTGDGAGVTAGVAVSLTALEDSEILLVDVDDPPTAI